MTRIAPSSSFRTLSRPGDLGARAACLLALIGGPAGTLTFAGSALPSRALHQPADPDPALRTYLAGNGFLNRGMYELAAAEYRRFLEEHPGHAKANTARYALAVAHSRMGQAKDAADLLAPLADLRDFEFGADARLLLAQCAMADADFAAAARQLAGLIEDFPAHARAEDGAALLAECRYRAGDPEGTARAADDFARRWPDSARRPRVELYAALSDMSADRFDRAGQRLEAIIAGNTDPALVPQATLLAAQCRERAGDLDSAADLYRAAVAAQDAARNPAEAAAPRLGLATVLYQQDNAPEAARLLDEVISRAPDAPSAPGARLLRARIYADAKDYAKAARLLTKVAADTQLADQAEYWLAKCELRAGDAQASAARLEKAIERHPKSALLPEMYYDRAVALQRADREKEAAETLAAFRSKFPDHPLNPDAIETLASLAYSAGDLERTASLCAEFLARHPDHPRTPAMRLLEAETDAASGRVEAAAAKLRQFLEQHADSEDAPRARLRLGTLLVRLGKSDEAAPILQSLTKGKNTDAASRSALLSLGEAHFRAGRYDQAARALEDYLSFGLQQPSADGALLTLGLTCLRLERPADAVAHFARLLDQFPSSPLSTQARFERAQALVALDRADEARPAFEQVLADPGAATLAPYAHSHLGALAMSSNDYSPAADHFARAHETAPDDKSRGEALFNRSQALMAAGRTDEAVAALAELHRRYPDHARAGHARAQRALAMARSDRTNDSLAEIDAVLAGAPPDAPLKDALLYERARCLRALSRDSDAAESLGSLLESPGEPGIRAYARLELAAIHEDAGRHAEAAEVLGPLVQTEPGQSRPAPELMEQAVYRMAAALYRAERPADAAPLLARFTRDFPASDLTASACLMLGECWHRQDRPKQAAPFFRRVVEEFPGDAGAPNAMLRLGECLAALQDWDGSRAAFAAYLDRHGTDELAYQARFGVAWADENQGQHDRAIEGYRAVTASQQGPTGARAQFQIGECLFAQKKYDQAVAELLKVDILYAYPEWSAAALYEAGRCFEAAGNAERAREHYQQVTGKYPDSKWAAQAAKRLRPTPASGRTRAGK